MWRNTCLSLSCNISLCFHAIYLPNTSFNLLHCHGLSEVFLNSMRNVYGLICLSSKLLSVSLMTFVQTNQPHAMSHGCLGNVKVLIFEGPIVHLRCSNCLFASLQLGCLSDARCCCTFHVPQAAYMEYIYSWDICNVYIYKTFFRFTHSIFTAVVTFWTLKQTLYIYRIFRRAKSVRNSSSKRYVYYTEFALLRVSPPSEPLKSFSLLQWVLSSFLIRRCFTRVLLLNPPCKPIRWQICKYERMQMEEAPKVHLFLTWNGVVGYIRFYIWAFKWRENVFLWHLMEVFPHCSIFKGLLYAMSIFNGSAAVPYLCADKKTSGEL